MPKESQNSEPPEIPQENSEELAKKKESQEKKQKGEGKREKKEKGEEGGRLSKEEINRLAGAMQSHATHIAELRSQLPELFNKLQELTNQQIALEKSGGENVAKLQQITQELNGVRTSIDSINKTASEYTEVVKDLSKKNVEAFNQFSQLLAIQAAQLEATQPEALRVPSVEKATEILRDRGELGRDETLNKRGKIPEQNPLYQKVVREWFEERLRHLESYEQTFEEHHWLLSPLEFALVKFELDPRTENLAEELKDKLESRRVKQRMFRVWYLMTPDGIFQESSRLTTKTLRELFTYRTPDGRPIIAQEFREYEKMAGQLQAIKEEMEEAKEKGNKEREETLKGKKELKEREIRDYYNFGGKKTIGGQEIDLKSYLQKLRKTSYKKDLHLIKQTEEDLWARKFAGELWTITQRAARYDISLNNSSGDFFNSRLLNFVNRLNADALVRKTKKMWGDETDPFDLRYRDLFSAIVGRMIVKEGDNKDNLDLGKLQRYGIKVSTDSKDKQVKLVATKDGEKMKLDWVGSLENADLENPNFWQDLTENHGLPENAYTTHMYYQMLADATRKKLIGAGAFFHSPSLGKFLGMVEIFEHVSNTETIVLTNEKATVVKDKNGNPIEISLKHRAWQDVLERALGWGKSEEGGELLEQWKAFPEAEMFAWISQADDEELITREQRDYLYKKYLKAPFFLRPFVSPETGAKIRSTVSILESPLRYGPFRALVGFGTFMEFVKRAFGYIFSQK